MKRNKDLCKPLFVESCLTKAVDYNYLMSILTPEYSEAGLPARAKEETVIDLFQDFLGDLESNKRMNDGEALAWRDEEENENNINCKDMSELEQIQHNKLTAPGILGWLTGQQHAPTNGEQLTITVKFDHECMSRNPNHTVCFPRVAACSREVTLPVLHMLQEDQFSHVFCTAHFKGSAFAKA